MTTFYSLIIGSRGYHVYKETSWSNTKLGDEVRAEIEANAKSIASDPYSCVIKSKHGYFTRWKSVGHIPREISQWVYFFIKQESGRVYGTLKSLT